MDDERLNGKGIIVTGGGGRLGGRMVRRFSEAGARVAAIVVSEEEGSRVPHRDHGSVVVIVADVLSESSIAEGLGRAKQFLGRVDALVHTVGMWGESALTDTSLSDWNTMIGVNLTSTFLCFREVVGHMEGSGTLIAMASRQGADGGVAGQAGYSAAKAGIVRLVESVAHEYREKGVRAHAIAPSAILFDEQGAGVQASELIDLAAYLIGNGSALNGATLRSYGSG